MSHSNTKNISSNMLLDPLLIKIEVGEVEAESFDFEGPEIFNNAINQESDRLAQEPRDNQPDVSTTGETTAIRNEGIESSGGSTYFSTTTTTTFTTTNTTCCSTCSKPYCRPAEVHGQLLSLHNESLHLSQQVKIYKCLHFESCYQIFHSQQELVNHYQAHFAKGDSFTSLQQEPTEKDFDDDNIFDQIEMIVVNAKEDDEVSNVNPNIDPEDKIQSTTTKIIEVGLPSGAPKKLKKGRGTISSLNNEVFCKSCNKTYSTSSALALHLHSKIHMGGLFATNVCKHCSRRFDVRQGLRRHQHNSILKTPLICQYCKSSFGFKCGFSKHFWNCKNSHGPSSSLSSPASSYKCKYCGKKFVTLGFLASHEQIHIKPPYNCSICHKKFSWKKRLKAHFEYTHPYTFVCQICCNNFSSEVALEAHTKKAHVIETAKATTATKSIADSVTIMTIAPSTNDIIEMRRSVLNKLLACKKDKQGKEELPSVSCLHCSKTFNDLASRGRHIRLTHRNQSATTN